MPKKIFWPIALIVMGLVFLAQNLGYFPSAFWNLWPLILIVVGLGGLVTSDRDRWMYNGETRKSNSKAKAPLAKAGKSKARSKR